MTGDRERSLNPTVDSSVCVANSATKYNVPDAVIFHNSIVASEFGQPGPRENDECRMTNVEGTANNDSRMELDDLPPLAISHLCLVIL
jgi:hypothetical protein